MAFPSSCHKTSGVQDFQLGLIENKHRREHIPAALTAPIFDAAVFRHTESLDERLGGSIAQYGLLGGLLTSTASRDFESGSSLSKTKDPRIFFNVSTPSSTFICGSQGSGKSHTLSCLLENCLIPSDAGSLAHPLSGILFHYDAFISDERGTPCEAAFLSSDSGVKVRILCAPTNIRTIERTYQALSVEVEALRFDETDLNTKRMLDLMALNQDDGAVPLYLHTVTRILRDMRVQQQVLGNRFHYKEFKSLLEHAGLSPTQLGPLGQRLDTLESFMVVPDPIKKSRKFKTRKGTDWSSKPGHLTIVDLSCPCITPATACLLFNIALSIFLEQNAETGRVVALDEAHKFMNGSAEAATFTNSLLSAIRLQRHLGTRVIISTQEPTISPALLDLSSLTVVHRFTSPEWLRTLRAHLAGAAIESVAESADGRELNKQGELSYARLSEGRLFNEIVRLRIGEALLFCPSAVLESQGIGEASQALTLGPVYLKIYIRERLTTDGGRTVMAD